MRRFDYIRTVRTLGHIRTKDTSGIVGEEDFGVDVGSNTLEVGVVGGRPIDYTGLPCHHVAEDVVGLCEGFGSCKEGPIVEESNRPLSLFRVC